MASLVIIALAVVGVVADYFIKVSGSGPKYISYTPFFIGMILYALTAIGWFYAMKFIKLSTIGVLYGASTAVLLAIAGVLLFKEQLQTSDIVGIVLGIASIMILGRFM